MKTELPPIIRNETVEQKGERLKREHEWRQILQQQFGELWLRLNVPQNKQVKLAKIRGSGGKAA